MRFLSRVMVTYYSWQVLVVGILAWYGLTGLKSAPSFEGLQSVWVAYSAATLVGLIVAFFHPAARFKAYSGCSMVVWYGMFAAVVQTPMVIVLYSGHAMFAALFAGVMWRLDDRA